VINLIYTCKDFQSVGQNVASVIQSTFIQDLYFLHTFIIEEVLGLSLETFLSPNSFCPTQKRYLSLELALVHLFILYRMVSGMHQSLDACGFL